MNQSMNYEGVCRTALATPGLSIILATISYTGITHLFDRKAALPMLTGPLALQGILSMGSGPCLDGRASCQQLQVVEQKFFFQLKKMHIQVCKYIQV